MNWTLSSILALGLAWGLGPVTLALLTLLRPEQVRERQESSGDYFMLFFFPLVSFFASVVHLIELVTNMYCTGCIKHIYVHSKGVGRCVDCNGYHGVTTTLKCVICKEQLKIGSNAYVYRD